MAMFFAGPFNLVPPVVLITSLGSTTQDFSPEALGIRDDILLFLLRGRIGASYYFWCIFDDLGALAMVVRLLWLRERFRGKIEE